MRSAGSFIAGLVCSLTKVLHAWMRALDEEALIRRVLETWDSLGVTFLIKVSVIRDRLRKSHSTTQLFSLHLESILKDCIAQIKPQSCWGRTHHFVCWTFLHSLDLASETWSHYAQTPSLRTGQGKSWHYLMMLYSGLDCNPLFPVTWKANGLAGLLREQDARTGWEYPKPLRIVLHGRMPGDGGGEGDVKSKTLNSLVDSSCCSEVEAKGLPFCKETDFSSWKALSNEAALTELDWRRFAVDMVLLERGITESASESSQLKVRYRRGAEDDVKCKGKIDTGSPELMAITSPFTPSSHLTTAEL
ncbi:hypothetical protein E6O75_ATG00499 [Venturia nashicola]|uniref:Uncharacterized protein n=1 Tax=Venturia nashicola TaxID=86259 RepID=A0A4Z1PX06_9PEZI|nr:hypothetical protein E6O75_ATG00499 [Venturia nashicola]